MTLSRALPRGSVRVPLALLLSFALAAPASAARPKGAGAAPQTFSFDFTPANADRSLEDYLKFVEQSAPGMDGLRAQYLVAELRILRGQYKEAAEILQKLAGVALNDEYFNVSVLEKLADCYMHQGLFQQAAEAYTTASNSSIKAIVPESILGLAVTSLALGDKEQAYLRFQELTAFYPAYKTKARFMLPMGLIQWESGHYQDGLDFFLRNDKDPACLYFAGLCQRAVTKPVEAMGTFKRVVRDHPKTVWAQRAKFELGETFYRQKDFPLSIENFSQVAKEPPPGLWETLATYRLACNDMKLKRYKEAESKLWPLQRGERDHPLHGNVAYLLTESLAEQNKMKDLVSLLKEENKGKAKTPDSQFRLIWSLTAVEDYEEAIPLANDSLAQGWDPEFMPKTLVVLGYAYEKTGRVPEAVASYQLAVDNFPDTPYAARALHLMAMAFYRSNQDVPVITQVNSQWNTLPAAVRKKHPETLFWIGEAHLRRENGVAARASYQNFLDLAPPDHPLAPQALLGQAVSHAVDKDHETAILTLQRTYQNAQEKGNKPFMAEVMFTLGNVYFNAKDYENAAASYRSFEQLDPKHPQMPFAMYQEGLALHRAEYYSDAVVAWDRMAKTYPKDAKAPEAMFRKAKTHFDLGQYPDAVKGYEAVVKSYPHSDHAKDARLQIGQCFYNAGDFAKAIVHYTDFLSRYPDDPQAPSVLALLQTCYYQAKKTPEEIEKLTRNQPKSPVLADIYWEEGAKHYNDKAYDKARDYFQKILNEFPTSSLAPQASFYRAESLYLQDRFGDAVPAYENFLQYYPEDGQRGLARFHLSVSLFNQKDFPTSAESFKSFADEFPDDPMAKNAVLNVALCHAKAQEVDKAVDAYEDYLHRYPASEDAGATYLQMGQLLEKAAKENRAAEVYRRAPKNLPEYPEALFSAGRCYRLLNNTDGEKQVYEELGALPAKNDPYRIAGLLQLGDILLAENDAARAAAVYQDVAQNAGDEASVAAARERLDALQPKAAPPPPPQ